MARARPAHRAGLSRERSEGGLISESTTKRTSGLTPHYLRDRNTEQGHRVTFVELLFGLVFVLTIIQLSHALAAHFTPLGVLETALLVLAVWWAWMYTTWFANWLDPDQWPVRTVIFALMFAALVVAVSIPDAFGERGLAFALAYVAMQLGRGLFAVWALRGNRRHVNFVRITAYFALAAPFWIVGAFTETGPRIALWSVALLIEYAGPALSFRVPGFGHSTHRDWDVSGAHMAERCALFVIICLGETILATGRVLADEALTFGALVAFIPAFLTTLLMWWLYFRFGYRRAERAIDRSATPGALARSGYTYAHIPIVAGIILAAVGAEFVVAHPHDPATYGTAVALVGGPLLFVGGVTWLKALVTGRLPSSHLAGLGALAFAYAIAPLLDLQELAVLTVAALTLAAAWERTTGASVTAMQQTSKSAEGDDVPA